MSLCQFTPACTPSCRTQPLGLGAAAAGCPWHHPNTIPGTLRRAGAESPRLWRCLISSYLQQHRRDDGCAKPIAGCTAAEKGSRAFPLNVLPSRSCSCWAGIASSPSGWAAAAKPGSTRAEGACGCSFLSAPLETCCDFNNQLQQNWAGPASLSTNPLATEHGLDNLKHMAGPHGDGPRGQGSAGSLLLLILVVAKEQLAQDPCSLQMSPQTASSEFSRNFGAAQVRAAQLKFTELHHTPQILVCPEVFSYKEKEVEKMICAQLLDNLGHFYRKG